MKQLMVVICCLLFAVAGFTQVTWDFSAKKISPSSYELHLTATTIVEGWHIYSQQSRRVGRRPPRSSSRATRW